MYLEVSWSASAPAKEAVMSRILVVDDDLHTRLAIRTWLKRCGFRVAMADGGANGLAALDDATVDLKPETTADRLALPPRSD
jgi:CheY-like chemotaxis protein